jgi:hypothetical protein
MPLIAEIFPKSDLARSGLDSPIFETIFLADFHRRIPTICLAALPASSAPA